MKKLLLLSILFLTTSTFLYAEGNYYLTITSPQNDAIFLRKTSDPSITVAWNVFVDPSFYSWYVTATVNGVSQSVPEHATSFTRTYAANEYTVIVTLHVRAYPGGNEIIYPPQSVYFSVYQDLWIGVSNNFDGGSVYLTGEGNGNILLPTKNAVVQKWVGPAGSAYANGIDHQQGDDGYYRQWKEWDNGNGSFRTSDLSLSFQLSDHNQNFNANYRIIPLVPYPFTYSGGMGQHPYLMWMWAPNPMNAAYEIERNLNSTGWVFLARVTSQSYMDNSFTEIPGFPYSVQYRVRAVSIDEAYSDYSSVITVQGKTGTLQKKGDAGQSVPAEFSLDQNYPNPFNPSTTISFALPKDEMVTLKIYDMMGHEVATLVNDYQSAGQYSISYDASKLSSGTYIYRIQAGKFSSVKKMQILK
ncbi:MAG TPA: T9SS type A sorting domain-containing protein [Bacteroidota bacterium]|nr:T9SS type A sorting domain-containing protein [Bacteroidota bacterium]